jgi:hypothetical protein
LLSFLIYCFRFSSIAFVSQEREAVEGAISNEEMNATEEIMIAKGALSAEKIHLATFATKIAANPTQCLR